MDDGGDWESEKGAGAGGLFRRRRPRTISDPESAAAAKAGRDRLQPLLVQLLFQIGTRG